MNIGTPNSSGTPPTRRVQVPAQVKKDVRTIAQTLEEALSVYQNPINIRATKDIPPKIHAWLDAFIKSHRDMEVFGSLGMTSYAPIGRPPGDLDAVVSDPMHVAHQIEQKLKMHGYDAFAVSHPWVGGWRVGYRDPQTGQEIWVADLHAKEKHKPNQPFPYYGSSREPVEVHGILVQDAADQLIRKANSIIDTEGILDHRAAKDIEDFVVIANTLLDSRELRARAKLEKVQEAKKAVQSMIKYAKSVKGANITRMRKDPIPASHERAVIQYARQNLDVDVRDIRISGGKVSHISRNGSKKPAPQKKDEYTSIMDYFFG